MTESNALDIFKSIVVALDWLVLGYLLFYCAHYLFQLITAWLELREVRRQEKQADPWWLLTGQVTFPISIVVSAYNEEKTIVDSLHAMLALHYPEYEVVVTNDGSKDSTLELLINAFDLRPSRRVYHKAIPTKKVRGVYESRRFPNLVVIDKENGGRSDANNAGINVARHPLICSTDADSIIEPDALLHLVRPFILHPEEMIAVGGKIRAVNGCELHAGRIKKFGLPRKPLALFQFIEYIRAFQMCRLAWNNIDTLILISGAFGLFKREKVLAVGGFSTDTIGEDMDMTMKLHRHHHDLKQKYRLAYVPGAVCWTEVPDTLKILRSQRCRWHRGLLEVLTKHKSMIFNPRYGRIGTLGISYLFIIDGVGPFLELLGLFIVPLSYAFGLLNEPFFLAYVSLQFCYGAFISVWCLFLEEITSKDKTRARDLAVLMLVAVLENFGYRQLNGLWRIEGTWQFFRKQQGWGKMTRTGFKKTGAAQRKIGQAQSSATVPAGK